MLKLIIRQILQRKTAVFFILIIWAISGYFIYQYKNEFFSRLSYLFSEPSLIKGKQDFKKAHRYFRQAQLYIKENQVDLGLMQQSCNKIPIKFTGSIKQFSPHWLQKLEDWHLLSYEIKNNVWSQQSAILAELPDYWQKNRSIVWKSLKSIADALQFAYEIPDIDTKDILLPHIFTNYAKALCVPHLAMLVWGNYVEFQERRVTRSIGNHSRGTLYLESLRGSTHYIEALRNFLGVFSSPSENGRGLRNSLSYPNREMGLVSVNLEESIPFYEKLIFVEGAEARPSLHLSLGKIYHIVAQKYASVNLKKENYYNKKALAHLRLAGQLSGLAAQAYEQIAFLWLEKKKYGKAIVELRRLQKMRLKPGFSHREFIVLVRRTLIGLGRVNEVDCFIHTRQKQPPHCTGLNL